MNPTVTGRDVPATPVSQSPSRSSGDTDGGSAALVQGTGSPNLTAQSFLALPTCLFGSRGGEHFPVHPHISPPLHMALEHLLGQGEGGAAGQKPVNTQLSLPFTAATQVLVSFSLSRTQRLSAAGKLQRLLDAPTDAINTVSTTLWVQLTFFQQG